MAIKSIPPPISAPLVDERGHVTAVWAGWFTNLHQLQKQQFNAVADGVYTVSQDTTTDGTITIVDGFITAIQEAVT